MSGAGEAGDAPRQPRAQRFDVSDETCTTPSTKDAETPSHVPGFATPDGLARLWATLTARQSARGRGLAVGVDGVRADVFARRLDQNLREIHRKLAQRGADGRTAYRFGPLALRLLAKPGGKARPVHVPRLRDQLVLRGVAEALQTAMKARGFATAAPSQRRCAALLRRAITRRGLFHGLRVDIASFYDSVPHEPVRAAVGALDLPPDIAALVGRALEAPVRSSTSEPPPVRPAGVGLPTGLSLSSVLGELHLAPLDAALRETGVFALRYVDDLLLLAATPEALDAAHDVLSRTVAALGLGLSEPKLWKGDVRTGVRFLGMRLDGDGPHTEAPGIDRWLAKRRRTVRAFAREMDAQPDEGARLDRFAALILTLNRDLTGVTGRLVPTVSGTGDLSPLEALDRGLRTALGGLYRRTGTRPTGRLRLASAVEWGHRWRRGPAAAREAAIRLFGLPTPA
jgi:hypothetical protein